MATMQEVRDYKKIRRYRRINAWVAALLATALTLLANYWAARHFWRVDFSRAQYYRLSPATRELLAQLPARLKITVLAAPDHELARDLRNLLKEYAYASDKITVSFVDPHRDLARSKELAVQFNLQGSGYLLLEIQDRSLVLPLRDLADYDYTPMLSGRPRQITAFCGESAISAAIHNLIQPRKPVMAFISGHGERDIEDYDPVEGYSMIARILRQHNLELKTLRLEANADLNSNCDVMVIAGPRRRFAQPEIEMLRAWLQRAGRLLIMLDAGADTGLDELLDEWGVRIGHNRVVDLTLTGRELLLNRYGEHAITARMRNLTTIFNAPCSVQPLAETNHPADRPRVTVLAATSDKGWAETSAYQTPPKFDPGKDQPGPVSVAVAVEKGPRDSAGVAMRPARLVVFGDASFVANGALAAGYNSDLFLNAANWLTESAQAPLIPVRPPPMFALRLDRRQINIIYAVAGGLLPAGAAMLGLAVWWRRRK